MKNFLRHGREVLLGAGLVALTIAVFGQTGSYTFIGIDDGLYILKNPNVRAGLKAEGVLWAATSTYAANWHPLTWISHMLDVELFGLDAGWHHLMNVLFHVANTVLLFAVFREMTGAPWRSAFVAALFAVHPLHVESVAWVAERKDVLSTLYWILAICAYARYARSPGVWRYLPVVALFALGLMCKPMLVTLPFVLILLDWWPLRRFVPGASPVRDGARLIVEKIPLLALSGASCAITYVAQRQGGAVAAQEQLSLAVRASNALVSYATYLWKTVWPASLSVFYPHAGSTGAEIAAIRVVVAAFLLCALTVLSFREGRRHPYVAVGWLWYLGTLVPVIGLVQVGSQAMADRYTYVPLIGIFAAVAWRAPEMLAGWRFRKHALGAAAGALLAALAIAAWVQAGYWRDNITLHRRALEVTEKNWLALYNLGVAYDEAGQPGLAVNVLRESVMMQPDDYLAWTALGDANGALGRHRQAVSDYLEALRYRNDHHHAWRGIGEARLRLGEPRASIPYFREAIRIRPDDAAARAGLGTAFLEVGQPREAIAQFRESLRLNPGRATAWNNLGSAYFELGQSAQAVPCFREALRIKSDYGSALYNLSLAYRHLGQWKLLEETYRLLRQADPAKADRFQAKHGPVRPLR